MHLAADLPAPRDDEPADLRRDIVDELADHLQCAIDRERQRAALEGNEEASTHEDHLWPRVVARFGHPARIARQLWWDAMKEKIMSQRTQTATLVVMSLFCVAMMIVTFMSLADSRQLARDNQNLNKQLLSQLEDLANRPAPAPAAIAPMADDPAEWNQLQVKCVWGAEDGEPAEGVEVYLSSVSENTAGIPSGAETSGPDGIVDFGKVLYGTYSIMITLPNHLTRTQQVAVRPGQDKTVTVVCPEGHGLGTVTLKPQFDWNSVPESLRGRVWVLCSIHKDNEASHFWDTQYEYEWPEELRAYGNAFESETGLEHNYDVASFLINEVGQVLPAPPLEVDQEELNAADLQDSRLRRVANMMYRLPEQPEYVAPVQLPAGGYHVYSQVLIVDPADASGRRLLAIESLPYTYEQMIFGSGGRPGGPMGSPDLQFQGGRSGPIGSRDRGGRGWGGGRDPDMTSAMPIQLGHLPFSYLAPVVSQSNMYGGSAGRDNQTQYIVRWNTETAWDFPVQPAEQLLLADVALRVPVGMDISLVTARVLTGEVESITPDSVVDLVWKGLVVDAEGNVIPEEHVLLTGLDVLATGEWGDHEAFELKEYYVPITPDEAGALMDTAAIASGLWVRPSTGPARESAGTPIDGALQERLRSDSVYVSAMTAEFPTGMKLLRIEASNSGVGDGMMDRGSYCDVVALGRQRSIPLLHGRLVHEVSYTGGGRNSNTYDIAVIVTAEEEAVVSQFLNAPGIHVNATPTSGPSEISPLESNPHLDELLQELEMLTDPEI